MQRRQSEWHVLHPDPPATQAELQQWLLNQRNISDVDQYVHPTDPLKITPDAVGIDVEALRSFCAALITAKEQQRRVVIAGDYDADGLCATAVLWSACQAIGLQAQPFIPNRHVHGYGLNQRSVTAIVEEFQPEVVATVDNGIVAHQAIAALQKQGIQVLVSDHHEKASEPLLADALVHTTQLCGAGVAWFVGRALLEQAGIADAEAIAESWLDLVAIATIADQVPLLNANRSLVVFGLQQLRTTKRAGLLALFSQARIEQSKITEWTVSFTIAPRLNALGRLAHGLDALRLLLSTSETKARQRAQLLEETNTDRQELTYDLYQVAQQQAKAQSIQRLIIVADESFHEGVIGLLASRLVEEFGKPAIVISTNDLISKGSVRSLGSIHITDFLRSFTDVFLELGGHAMAAGFALESSKLTEAIKELQSAAAKQFDQQSLEPSIEVLCPLSSDMVSFETIKTIEQCAPFGQANPRPVFLLDGWQVVGTKVLGKQQNHLKIIVRPPVDNSIPPLELIWWKHGNRVDELRFDQEINVIGTLEQSEWRNKKSLQFTVQDLQIDR